MRRILLVMAVTLAACSSDNASTPTTTDRACPATDVADRAEITQVRANLLLGYVEADAQRCAAELGWAYRVGMRDGESFAVTEDYSLQRVTVSIDDGVVVAIVVG
jgi:outer membrane biogenesis lipoprotein LolB